MHSLSQEQCIGPLPGVRQPDIAGFHSFNEFRLTSPIEQVQVTLRGDEALEICRLFRPDVVIADVNMPGTSGYAIARELRQRHGNLAPLLIAISGVWTNTTDRLLGQAVGFDHYLLKPCDPKEVVRLIETRQAGESEGKASSG